MRICIDNHKAISWNKLYSQKFWGFRSALAREIHDLVWGLIPLKKRKIFSGKVDISIRAFYKDNRRRDSDNVCSKLYIDGLKGIVLTDDDPRFVRKVTTEAIIGAKENKVLIIFKKV